MAGEYCALGTGVCLSPEAWAAWVQAVGSVVAIVAAVAVVDFQLRKQEKARVAAEREREMALCRDAFLAARSYQLAMRDYAAELPDEATDDASRHLRFPHVWIDFYNGGYSPRDLAFLIPRHANDVLSCYYTLHVLMREWTNRIERLFEYRGERIAPLLEARSREVNRLLSDGEQLTLIGPYCSAEIARMTARIEALTRGGGIDIKDGLRFLKGRLAEIYPELALPEFPD